MSRAMLELVQELSAQYHDTYSDLGLDKYIDSPLARIVADFVNSPIGKLGQLVIDSLPPGMLAIAEQVANGDTTMDRLNRQAAQIPPAAWTKGK